MFGLVDGNNFFVSCERVRDPSLEGRAVAVISNENGCCVSRSNEFKALGIPMGTPRFKLRDLEERGKIILLPAQHDLYSELSDRIMSVLRAEAVRVEQYSIDEAFVVPPTTVFKDLEGWGTLLRNKVLAEVGIPCGIGFAPTKTLAKIADHIAKKRPEGVYELPREYAEIINPLPVGEVWGIGRRLAGRLHAERIFTVEQLLSTPTDRLHSIGGINLQRTVQELCGEAVIAERDYDAAPESISYSRAFLKPIRDCDGLCASIATYASHAAEKLRRHNLRAAGCVIYAQYGPTLDRTFFSREVVFPVPTDATNLILSAIKPAAESLFVPEYVYRKSGITFYGLTPRNGVQQDDFFAELTGHTAETTREKASSKLFKVVDALNEKYGKNTVHLASTAQ